MFQGYVGFFSEIAHLTKFIYLRMEPFPKKTTKTPIGNGLALRHLHLPPQQKGKTVTLATNEGLIEFLQG